MMNSVIAGSPKEKASCDTARRGGGRVGRVRGFGPAERGVVRARARLRRHLGWQELPGPRPQMPACSSVTLPFRLHWPLHLQRCQHLVPFARHPEVGHLVVTRVAVQLVELDQEAHKIDPASRMRKARSLQDQTDCSCSAILHDHLWRPCDPRLNSNRRLAGRAFIDNGR